ncbi:MAG: hypothetical protein J6Z03_02245 [Erysipelotrichaceae bacterium]|nr:hypothetical protein [Erysipelotrichaceae bacterium]
MSKKYEEQFMKLVEENKGFEYYQAYRDDVDHILGGKDDTYWYTILKDGKVRESYIGKYKNGSWEDVHIKGRGANQKSKAMPEGSTIKKIAEKAYLMQDEEWVTSRTPKPIEDEHPHYHYMKGFGDKGLDVSVKYGVTITYSDISDPDAGFHLRYLYTGNDVELP